MTNKETVDRLIERLRNLSPDNGLTKVGPMPKAADMLESQQRAYLALSERVGVLADEIEDQHAADEDCEGNRGFNAGLRLAAKMLRAALSTPEQKD